jgi:hypothetical protein
MQYAAFGSVVLGIGITLYILKKYGRMLNIMFLLAGAALSPALKGWVGGTLASLGGMLFGIAAAGCLAAMALTWLVVEFKGNGKHKRTPWVALLLPVLLATSGLPIFLKIADMGNQVLKQGNAAVTQTK